MVNISQCLGLFFTFTGLIALNLVILVFELLNNQHDFNYDDTCKRMLMITIGAFISLFQLAYFISVQFIFFKNINKSDFY